MITVFLFHKILIKIKLIHFINYCYHFVIEIDGYKHFFSQKS